MSGTATIFIAFQPTAQAPFQFQATMTPVNSTQSAAYTFTVTWLFGGNRWYVNCYDQNNNWIFTLPLIGSPVGTNISITAGYFVTTLVYRVATGNFEVG